MNALEAAAVRFVADHASPQTRDAAAKIVREFLRSVLPRSVEVLLTGSRVTVPKRIYVSVSDLPNGASRILRFEIGKAGRFAHEETFRTSELLRALCVAADRAGGRPDLSTASPRSGDEAVARARAYLNVVAPPGAEVETLGHAAWLPGIVQISTFERDSGGLAYRVYATGPVSSSRDTRDWKEALAWVRQIIVDAEADREGAA